MKYLVQIMAMLSDIIIAVACVSLLYYTITHPSLLLILITIFMLAMTYNTWKSQGGLIAWTRKGRTAFFKNWDDIVRKR